MATAFANLSVGTEQDLFNAATDGGGVTTYLVHNAAASAVDLLVNVSGLHAVTEWFPIAPGQKEMFRSGQDDITRIRAKAASGTVTASGGVVAKLAHVSEA